MNETPPAAPEIVFPPVDLLSDRYRARKEQLEWLWELVPESRDQKGCRGQELEFEVEDVGLRIEGSEFRRSFFRFRVRGVGLKGEPAGPK